MAPSQQSGEVSGGRPTLEKKVWDASVCACWQFFVYISDISTFFYSWMCVCMCTHTFHTEYVHVCYVIVQYVNVFLLALTCADVCMCVQGCVCMSIFVFVCM